MHTFLLDTLRQKHRFVSPFSVQLIIKTVAKNLSWCELTQLAELKTGQCGVGAQAVGLSNSQRVDGLPVGEVVNVTVLVDGVHDAWRPLGPGPPLKKDGEELL